MQPSSANQLRTTIASREKICQTCRNLNQALQFKFQDDFINAEHNKIVVFHRKQVDFYNSHKLSCRFCSIILQVISSFSDDLSESTSIVLSKGMVYLHFEDLPFVEIYSPEGLLLFCLKSQYRSSKGHLFNLLILSTKRFSYSVATSSCCQRYQPGSDV